MKKLIINLPLGFKINKRLISVKALVLLVLTLIVVSISKITYGTVYHVSSLTEANSVGEPGDTIMLAAGTYDTDSGYYLWPKTSGEEGKYITYMPEDGTVTITGTQYGINLNARHYIHIKGLHIVNTVGSWIQMNNSDPSHIIIEDCYMEGNAAWAGINMKGASYVKVLNNTMISTCSCTSYCLGSSSGGPHDILSIINSHHNLIEGNKMYNGIHDNVDMQDTSDGSTGYNIIRNNFFYNKWHANIDVWGIEYLLVENNTIYDAGEEHLTNYCSRSDRDPLAAREQHKGIHINGQYAIVRDNVSINNGRGYALVSASSDTQYKWKNDAVENYIYGNTFYKNQDGLYHNSTDPSVDNVVKNNIFCDEERYEIFVYDGTGTPSTNHFINNNIKGASSSYSSMDTRTDNVSVNPGFVDADNRDLRLATESPMIDAGAWLTFTANSGTNSTSMQVEDARYFMDGWGLIGGDSIQVEGQTLQVCIDSVDYDNNTLILSSGLSWEEGKGVSRPYKGEKPDIGAYEGEGVVLADFLNYEIEESLDIEIYPNPVTDILNVESENQQEGTVNIQLSDIYGKVVYLTTGCLLPDQIDMSSCPDGIYIVRVWDDKGFNYSLKVIKQ